MTPTEFEMDGHWYRIGRMNAFEQFHVSRKISPLIPPLIPVFMQMAKNTGGPLDVSAMSGLFQPFADGFAALPDDSAEYVINTCLKAVRRKNERDEWVPVWSVGGKQVMFDDLNNLSVMLRLVLRVIKDSLGDFLTGLLSGQESSTTPQAPAA